MICIQIEPFKGFSDVLYDNSGQNYKKSGILSFPIIPIIGAKYFINHIENDDSTRILVLKEKNLCKYLFWFCWISKEIIFDSSLLA